MLEVKELTLSYGERRVIDRLSFSLPSGSTLAILGPNGAGKSTLLRALGGLLRGESGEILYDGESLSALTPRERAQRCAFLSQERATPSINAETLVLHGRFPYLGFPRRYTEADKAAVRAALKRTDALSLVGRNMEELSGGERQRVYLALTLCQDTPYVLLDEPTTYLDVAHAQRLPELCRELNGAGKTVITVLHDLPLALRAAQRILLLSEGELFDFGATEEVIRRGSIERLFGVSLGETETEQGKRYYYQ